MDARPFEVSIPQEKLDDLRERLARTRWPDEVAGTGWDYGSNLAYMKGETLSIPNPKSEGKNQRGHLLWPARSGDADACLRWPPAGCETLMGRKSVTACAAGSSY